MNSFIPMLYLLACLLLFPHATQFTTTPIKRVKYYFLAFALMCFGCGRLLWAVDPAALPTYEWMFDIAHLCLCIFVGLYWWCAVQTKRKTR